MDSQPDTGNMPCLTSPAVPPCLIKQAAAPWPVFAFSNVPNSFPSRSLYTYYSRKITSFQLLIQRSKRLTPPSGLSSNVTFLEMPILTTLSKVVALSIWYHLPQTEIVLSIHPFISLLYLFLPQILRSTSAGIGPVSFTLKTLRILLEPPTQA